MSMTVQVLSVAIVMSVGIWTAQEKAAQDKPAQASPAPATATATPAGTTPVAGKKENPVKSSPEVLAAAKKVFGYDCAMCHGESGNGKGDLVESMSLKMKDWATDSAVLKEISDADMYDLIVKGKDKMVGEGDRLTPAKVWGLVLYVRSFQKKSGS
jgi:mono/diheme cytochrome c family protein